MKIVSKRRHEIVSANQARRKLSSQLHWIERLEQRSLMASDLQTWCDPFVGEEPVTGSSFSSPEVWSASAFDKRLSQQDPDYFYAVAGAAQGLIVHPKRVAIDWTVAANVDDNLLSELGLTFVRTLNSQYSVYETADPQVSSIDEASLRALQLVQDIAPVFVVAVRVRKRCCWMN